jgi:hypothetical protein
MEFLDLNTDTIAHICKRLDLIDLTLLSSTCSRLRDLSRYIEVKQRALFRKVRDDINAIEYMDFPQEPGSRSYSSVRIHRQVTIEYNYSTLMGILFVKYDYPQCDDPLSCPLDGGYPDVRKYQRFRTNIDSSMWYVVNKERSIERRQLPCAAVKIRVSVDRYYYTQTLEIYESAWYINDKPHHYPLWADDFKPKSTPK